MDSPVLMGSLVALGLTEQQEIQVILEHLDRQDLKDQLDNRVSREVLVLLAPMANQAKQDLKVQMDCKVDRERLVNRVLQVLRVLMVNLDL